MSEREGEHRDGGREFGVEDSRTPGGGVPDEGVPDEGVPDEGVPDEGVPDEGVPDEGVPDEGVPDGGVTIDRSPSETTSATRFDVVELLPRPRVVARLARREARLTIRRGWALGLTALFLAFGLLIATFSGASVAPDSYEPVVASYVELATFLVPLVALAFGHGAIVGAAERGRLGVVLTLPVSQGETVAGILLGRALVLAGTVVVGFGVPGLLLLREFGVAGWPTFAWFLFATTALAITLLAVGVAISALSSTSTMALAAALLVWVWVALVHDLLALGVLTAVEGVSEVAALLVAANPVATYRLLALVPTEAGGAGLAAALDASGLTATLLVTALAAWTVIASTVAAVGLRTQQV